MTSSAGELLAMYLDDHWAGAGAGAAVARRLARNNRDTEWGSRLARIAAEIAEDEQTLGDLRAALGVGGGRLKRAAALVAERVSRLKPNGRVVGYSPLSRVVETETLLTGVLGKRLLWSALGAVSHRHPALAGFDLTRLADRAESQMDALGRFHEAAARAAFGDASDIPPPPG